MATEVPEAFLDLGKESIYRSKISSVSAWAVSIKKHINDAFETAESILVREGFAPNSAKSTYHHRKLGVARDIITESRKGYDAMIVGRSGVSRIQEVVLGSVTSKILCDSGNPPIAVVGGCPETDNILIGFDSSESAGKAIDAVCNLMASDSRDVMLCHVVRSLNLFLHEQIVFGAEEEKMWLDETRQGMEVPMLEAEQKLIDAGFHPGRTYKQVLEDNLSRAAGIVQAASDGGYGTIVVGRRGLSRVQQFIMGRVSRKVLHMAKEMTVWVI